MATALSLVPCPGSPGAILRGVNIAPVVLVGGSEELDGKRSWQGRKTVSQPQPPGICPPCPILAPTQSQWLESLRHSPHPHNPTSEGLQNGVCAKHTQLISVRASPWGVLGFSSQELLPHDNNVGASAPAIMPVLQLGENRKAPTSPIIPPFLLKAKSIFLNFIH